MPWMETDIMLLRKTFIEDFINGNESIVSLCNKFQISRVTGYKWLKRYEEEGLAGLSNQSKRPNQFRKKTDSELVSEILKLRNEFPEWGGRKLRQVMINNKILNVPSEATINRILKVHNQINPEKSAERTKLIRFEHPNPNDLWQMDFKGHFQMKSGRCHPLTILDDHSRFAILLKAFDSEDSILVKKALEEVFMEYGLPLAMTMDNGPQWKRASKLYIWLMRVGIKVSHSRPYHPQTQGKEERFHRTLKEELLKYRQFENIEIAQRSFNDWIGIYNGKRPHEGIGMLCPVDKYSKSLRLYNGNIPDVEYEPDDIVRKVRSCGQIAYEGKNYFVGEYLSGEFVALRQMKENSLDIYFVNTRLSRIEL